jgi:chromosome partitioning protein
VIVTVGNTKGGVGKTTLAVQLALARALAGRDVLMVDGDRQGSAQMAIAVRAEAGRTPGLACVQYPDGAVLRAQVQRQRAKYDDVVIDAGGRDSTALRAALILSDRLIVPFLPRSATACRSGRCSTRPTPAPRATTPRPRQPWPISRGLPCSMPRSADARLSPTRLASASR